MGVLVGGADVEVGAASCGVLVARGGVLVGGAVVKVGDGGMAVEVAVAGTGVEEGT